MIERILAFLSLLFCSAVVALAILLTLSTLCGCSDVPEYRRPYVKPPVEDTVLVCDRWGNKLENCKHVARGDLDGYFGQ